MDSKPIIKVYSFKSYGKWYTTEITELKDEHCKLHGFELLTLIRNNDPSVRVYSGLSSGFSSKNMHFVIDVDYGEVNNFCTYLIPATEEWN